MGSGSSSKVKITEQERALGEVSAEQYNDYATRYRPLNEGLRDRIRATDAERAQAASSAVADAEIAFQGSERAIGAGLQAAGARPGTGRAVMSLAGNNMARTSARGLGAAQAVQGTEDAEMQGLLKLSAFGRGLAHDTTLSMSEGARTAAASSQQKARLSQQNNLWLGEGLGSLAGWGTANVVETGNIWGKKGAKNWWSFK